MNELEAALGRWQVEMKWVRGQIYRAPTARERERWHVVWLAASGWTVGAIADALERDSRTVEGWLQEFIAQGPSGLAFEQSGGAPPPSMPSSKRR